MKKLFQPLGNYFERVPAKLRKRKVLTWLIFIILTGLVGSGISRLKSELSFEYFFAADDPVKLAYNEMRSIFGSDEVIYVMYRAKDGDVLSNKSLQALNSLQNEIEAAIYEEDKQIDHLTEVRTLINVDYTDVQGDTLSTFEFIGDRFPRSDHERESLRRKALAGTNTYSGLYISEDSKYGGIVIRTDFNAEIESQEDDDTGTDILDDKEFYDEISLSTDLKADLITFKKTGMAEYKVAVDQVDKILDQDRYTEVFEYYKIGKPVQMAWAMKAMSEEMGTVMMGAFVIVALALLVLFRSLSAIVWPLLIVGISVVYTLGFMGWTGILATSFTQIIVFLILAMGVADAIHVLSGYIYFRGQGEDHETAIRHVYKKSGVAILLTTLTTSIGLLALTLVPIEPIKYFGIAAAFGIWIALGITIYVLPVMLELWAPRQKKASAVARPSFLQKWLNQLETVVQKRGKSIIITIAVLTPVLLFGGTQVVVDSNDIKALKPWVKIRRAAEAVDRHMAGSSNLEIMIDTGVTDGFKDPVILTRIDSLQQALEKNYPEIITKSVSLANVVKESNRILHEGKMAYYTIPSDPTTLSQILFLFDISSAKDRRQIITDDYQTGKISLTLKNVGTKEGNILFQEVKNLLDETFKTVKIPYPDFKITLTGQLAMSTRLATYVTNSQLQSFGIAFAVITLMMPLIMGGITMGLIAMIPNLFPVIAVFGVMGFLKIPLEMHTLLVAPIIIGVAVDDTIHFLTHFQMERGRGATISEAIQNTYREVGQAITFTSIVLSAGFLIFVTSSSLGLTYFGSLAALAMFTALICDLLLLPAILNRLSETAVVA